VFGIQTGVAISFLVKKRGSKGARIFYARRPEMETASEKLVFLSRSPLRDIPMDEINPDKSNNWLNITSNDFEELMPIASKGAKLGKRGERAIFKLFSLGVVTARDEWVYGESAADVAEKVHFLIDAYNAERKRLEAHVGDKRLADRLDYEIKWTRAVKNDLRKQNEYVFDQDNLVVCLYRPFVKRSLYFSQKLNEMQYQLRQIFGRKIENRAIFVDVSGSKPFSVLSTDGVFDYHANGDSVCFPLFRYDAIDQYENVSDWALNQFREHYGAKGRQAQPITKNAIFNYVYAVLHDPVYREKYAQNLKRDLPRIPLYGDSTQTFWQWATWGETLMTLHIGYESVEAWPLQRIDVPDKKSRDAGQSPKTILRADKSVGTIAVDSETTLASIPSQAWDYKLGNRSALEWILDQHKESKPRDPTIRAKFDTYRFAAKKEQVIDLLMRATRVSVETQRVVEEMSNAQR
jgi:predicted helicase